MFSRPRLLLQVCKSPFILILAVSVHCLAAVKNDAPVIQTPLRIDDPLTSGWASGDFDGDHKIDIAQTRSIGHTGNGYLYRVHLKLSRVGQSASFTFSNTDGLGVAIAAIDVDGDRDLDLVISSRFLGKRIGIWINDGNGSFSQDLHSLYSTAENPALEPLQVDVSGQAVGDNAARRFPALLPDAKFIPSQHFAIQACSTTAVNYKFRILRGQQHLRAPPAIASI